MCNSKYGGIILDDDYKGIAESLAFKLLEKKKKCTFKSYRSER